MREIERRARATLRSPVICVPHRGKRLVGQSPAMRTCGRTQAGPDSGTVLIPGRAGAERGWSREPRESGGRGSFLAINSRLPGLWRANSSATG
jgi:hypothetical protein